MKMLFFLAHGYRVVAHDRRGHCRSSQTADGHDMDHYTADASAFAEALDLRNAVRHVDDPRGRHQPGPAGIRPSLMRAGGFR
jgi:non-heme chloroperoxidase